VPWLTLQQSSETVNVQEQRKFVWTLAKPENLFPALCTFNSRTPKPHSNISSALDAHADDPPMNPASGRWEAGSMTRSRRTRLDCFRTATGRRSLLPVHEGLVDLVWTPTNLKMTRSCSRDGLVDLPDQPNHAQDWWMESCLYRCPDLFRSGIHGKLHRNSVQE
jgi:hypothetical protein